jgi:hypothetical protein
VAAVICGEEAARLGDESKAEQDLRNHRKVVDAFTGTQLLKMSEVEDLA